MKLAFQDRGEANGWAAIFVTIAVISVGQAIQIGWGCFHPTAIVLVGVALAALVLGVLCSRLSEPGPWVIPLVRGVGIAAVAIHLAQLVSAQPVMDFGGLVPALLLLFFAAFTIPLCLDISSFKRFYTVGWFISFCAITVWILFVTFPPLVDVFWYTHVALDALMEGTNPYTIWMPNIYGEKISEAGVDSADKTNIYAQPITPDGKWVKCSYPYPPFSLMLSGLGYLFGDMRWANLAFIVGGVAMLLRSGGRFAALGAALLLTTPRIFFVIGSCWTDAYCFGLLAMTAGLASRSSRLTPWVFGLTLVSKQYMILLAPLALLLLPKPWNRKQAVIFVGQAVLAGSLVTLPWILWNPQAVLGATSGAVNLLPRSDALSFLFLLTDGGKGKYVDILPFLLLIPTYALIFLFTARGAASFALGSALILSVFFSFAKHAFCNHHFLVLGCAAVALALSRFEAGCDRSTPAIPSDKDERSVG